MANSFVKFCRLRLGLKPVFDYVAMHQKLLGITDLDIRTVFDIGANKGKKLRQYRRTFPQAKLYGVEPLPVCCERLQHWAAGQQGRVEILNLAMSSQPSQTTIYQSKLNTGWSSLRVPGRDDDNFVAIPVQVETLDRVASRLTIEDHLLVKIDVEGLDLEVIKGGLTTLQRAAAVIVEIAVPEYPGAEPEFFEFVRVMRDLGLQYRGNLGNAVKDGIIAHVDAVFIRPGVARRQAA